jgi:glycosyltransferase involved in cell wall biosynthesis
VPVIANARCKVLAGQCLRSNGGLFYHGYAEFAEALRLLLRENEIAASLGRQGKAYVDREYAWETIDAKLEGLLTRRSPTFP